MTRSGGNPIRILSLDGGGMLGLIEAVILADLEQRAGLPAGRLFDLIAGTSTGGIIALALARLNHHDAAPKYSANALKALYRAEGPVIFGKATRRFLWPLRGPKYDGEGLRAVMDKYFGLARLSGASLDVLVPAYDLEARQPVFFKSWEAKEGPDWYMADVAVATASAPTYLPPATVQSVDGRQTRRLWDGGLAANCPAMCAYAEAKRHCPGADVILVSIGAGDSAQAIDYRAAGKQGVLQLAPKIVGTAIDGPMDCVDYQCRQLIGDGKYFRLCPRIEKAVDRMDDASPQHLDRVADIAHRYCYENRSRLDSIAALLTGRKEAA